MSIVPSKIKAILPVELSAARFAAVESIIVLRVPIAAPRPTFQFHKSPTSRERSIDHGRNGRPEASIHGYAPTSSGATSAVISAPSSPPWPATTTRNTGAAGSRTSHSSQAKSASPPTYRERSHRMTTGRVPSEGCGSAHKSQGGTTWNTGSPSTIATC